LHAHVPSPVPGFLGHRFDVAAYERSVRAVDDDRQCSEALNGVLHHGLDATERAHISLESFGCATRGADAFDVALRLVAVDIHDQHTRAFFGQASRSRAPNALRTTGNNRYMVRQSLHFGRVLPWPLS